MAHHQSIEASVLSAGHSHDKGNGHSHGHHGDQEGNGHVSSLKVLFAEFAALMVLTIVTVVVARVPLGEWNLIVAMVIATIKATLVALFFMHLFYDKGFVRITFVVSLLFLSLFITFCLMDTGAYQKDIIWHETLKQTAPAAPSH